jgi:short-subunit dehydrogenase
VKALVTGASSGIGLALARRLAKRGFEVWLGARRKPALDALADEIRAAGGAATSVTLDVSQPEATEAAVSALDAAVGGFDLVVANAGIGGEQTPAHRQTLAGARATIETNYLGALATILPVVPGMVKRGRGHVAAVTSLAGEIALPAAVDYGTSKCALSVFLASATPDLEPLGVAVTDVRPGFVRTPLTDKNQFEMPFLVELEDAARIIDEGLAKRRRVIRFPLPLTLAISGGNALPAALRNALIRSKRPI